MWHYHHHHLPPPGFGPPFWVHKPHVRGLLHIAVLRLLRDQPLYGSEVQRLLKERFGVEVSGPAIYVTLRRLEELGLVVSTWDTSGPGPARRVYRITEEGQAYLEKSMEGLRKLRELLEKIVGEPGPPPGH